MISAVDANWAPPEWMVREFARAAERTAKLPPGYRPVICPPIIRKREAGQ